MFSMLTTDYCAFEARFPDAASFVLAASLRYELYCHLRMSCQVRTPFVRDRIKELLHAPCCQVPWFMALLRNDCADADELLVAAGL